MKLLAAVLFVVLVPCAHAAGWVNISDSATSQVKPGYWATGKGILISTDKGATRANFGSPVDGMYGPMFGKDETHFVVVGKSGLQETKDGGKTWQIVAPLPAGFGVSRVGSNYAWDAKADIFYASTMTKPTFRFQREKTN